MKPIAYRNLTLRKSAGAEQPKEKLSDVYRFLKHYELTASLAFQKVCDSRAAEELISFAEKVLFPDMAPALIRMKLAKRWASLRGRKPENLSY